MADESIKTEQQQQAQELECRASQSQRGIAGEFVDFLLQNKKWWLTPIILVLLLVGLLLVLGGTFFSAEMLPPALYAAAQLNPVYHMNQAFKAVALGDVGMGVVWPSLLFLCVFTLCAVWMGGRAYNRMLRVEQRSRGGT